MRGQRFKLLPEFQISGDPVSMITLPEFSIVDSCLKLDPIKCTTGPVEHVEFKSDGTMIWYERSHKIVVKSSKQTSTYRYKEEGGQGNALSVDVKLLDSKGKIVLGQAVPFELQCLTRFMKRVENQDEILQVKKRKGHDTVLKINEDTGTATVVFRFDKVSSKHKGPFSLHVGPNLARDATCARIYGSRSTPVVVKSKRSKESKRKLAAMKSSSNGDGALTTTTTKTKENKRRRKVGKMNKDALRVAVEHKAAVPTTSSTKLLKIGTLSAVFFSRQDSPHTHFAFRYESKTWYDTSLLLHGKESCVYETRTNRDTKSFHVGQRDKVYSIKASVRSCGIWCGCRWNTRLHKKDFEVSQLLGPIRGTQRRENTIHTTKFKTRTGMYNTCSVRLVRSSGCERVSINHT